MFFFHSAIYNHKWAYLSFKNSIPQQLTNALWSLFRLWPVKKEEIETFFNTIEKFTNACSIHSTFYQWRMIDDNQKRFIPQLAIETELFHSAFVNPCMIENQRRSQSGVRLAAAHLHIECIMGNLCTRWRHCFKGLSLDGGQADFSKKPRDASFTKDLSNEPTFGRIHLARQNL